jgi:hypothetical protein
MNDETPPKPPGPGGLQFDRVDPAPAVVAECRACRGPLGSSFYLAGVQKICASCAEGARKLLPQGNPTGRILKAVLLGSLAALAGGLTWAFITYKSEGTIYGIVAIGLGYLVGIAVRKGAGTGGRGYQALAIGLTYLAIGTGYVGAAIPEIGKSKRPAAAEEKAATPGKDGPAKPAIDDEPAKAHAEPAGCLAMLVVLGGLLLSAPVMVGLESPFTYFFLAIALWEAWKLNKGVRLDLKGPFSAASAAGGG